MESDTPAFYPAYYPFFSCKCGACRHSCCADWQVSVSPEELAHCAAMHPSPALRAQLADAVGILDETAFLRKNADGDCVLHRADGLCALQAELGEAALPEICRLFPRRAEENGGILETCAMNSCETVLELLWEKPDAMELQLPQSYASASEREKVLLRAACIRIVANASPNDAEKRAALASLLSLPASTDGKIAQQLPYFYEAATHFSTHSPSAAALFETALAAVGMQTDPATQSPTQLQKMLAAFAEKRAAFAAHYPDFESFFGRVLANYLFEIQFPDPEDEMPRKDAYLAFCVTDALIRFVLYANFSPADERQTLIDRLARLFRLISHTRFAYNLLALCNRRGLTAAREIF